MLRPLRRSLAKNYIDDETTCRLTEIFAEKMPQLKAALDPSRVRPHNMK